MAEAKKRRGPRPAGERLRRLLVMLPWVMERGEVRLADMAAHFKVTEDELVSDLELAAMCGLPPYLDELIDVFIDDGTVVVGVPRLFTKPLRLTAPEAFALLAAAEAASALPGVDAQGALPRALAKVRAKLGTKVDIDIDPPPFTEVVREATERSAVLTIRYWTAGRDEVTSRRVVPRQVFVERGDFYVAADDERSGQERTFRIDRIEAVEDTGEVVASRVVAPRAGQWFDDGGLDEAVLVLDPSAAWIADRYPVRRVTTLADGRLEVVVPVASERWLGRALLRLGTTAEVREPEQWTGLAAETAERVLAGYRRA